MSDGGVRDVVLMSRARLARNFSDIPFPGKMRGDDGAEVLGRVAGLSARLPQSPPYALLRMHELEDGVRRSLAERHLISRALLSGGASAAVLLREDEALCVMVNEEDHLRIHALLQGKALAAAAEAAFAVEAALGEAIPFAFDAELGYLTSDLANTGTGLRASALLHLPALTRSRAVAAAAAEVSKLGLFLRPLQGDADEAQGELYLIGNQVALGRSERELIDAVDAAVEEMIVRERAARESLVRTDVTALEDRVMRSLGVLRYARRLPEPEWMRRWSDVRLAAQVGLCALALPAWDALLSAARPAHLEIAADRELSPTERDEARARLVRAALQDPS